MEQPLPNYGNCLLASQVLYKYVNNPYTSDAEFDMDLFLEDNKYAVKFMDVIIDLNINRHPLDEQRQQDAYGRRMGLGFTGLTDMWAMLGMNYGSSEALALLDDILFRKAVNEIESSIELAKEKGHAPCFKTKKSRKDFIEQPYIQKILSRCLKGRRDTIINAIMNYGIRNASYNSIAPTGSLSIVAGNCTSGIEPMFSLEYYRETRLNPGVQTRMIHLPLLKHLGENIFRYNKEDIKKNYNYQEAHEINYLTRIKVQETVQNWIDSAVSSTVNLNEDCTIDDIFNIYLDAYEHKLKGITVFRDGCKKGVLSTKKNEDDINNKISKPNVGEWLKYIEEKLSKPLRAYKYVKPWKRTKIHITVSIDENDNPMEIFAHVPQECGNDINGNFNQGIFNEMQAYWNTITRMISRQLQANVPLMEVIKSLKKSSNSIGDLPAILLSVLSQFTVTKETIEEIKATEKGGELCPSCGKEGIIYQGGCQVCILCGDSKCG